MTRLNVYVPDELADAARAAELNVSAITQDAIRSALQITSVNAWIDSLAPTGRGEISHTTAQRALDEARAELWDDA